MKRGDLITEAQLQAAVVELARFFGWRHYHAFDSRRSARGWPDLVLCRPPRLVFVELKSAGGRLTPEQRDWLAALAGVPGIEAGVWRPADWTDGRIEAALR